jgi:release factor glutamine methyltransferase
MNCQEKILKVAKILQEAGIDNPRLDARILMADILNSDENTIRFNKDKLSEEELKKIDSYIQRRLSFEPVAKIIGKKEFYKSSFIVNQNVLDPRPDTEITVEAAINYINKYNLSKLLDLGTGSGCIAISIARDIENIEVIAVDKSEKALEVATKNVELNNVSDKVKLFNSSWYDEDIIEKIGSGFDIIVSNPPYIPSEDIKNLDVDVRKYDPISALDGGEDGLDDYRKIAELSSSILVKSGYILLEIGINQTFDVKKIFEAQSFQLIEIVKDYSSIDRCMIFRKK